MCKIGQKLYNVWNGVLEEVTFIEESLADFSCTETTYLVRGRSGQKFRCPKKMYCESKLEAYERYRNELWKAKEHMVKYLEEAKQHAEFIDSQITETSFTIFELKATLEMKGH